MRGKKKLNKENDKDDILQMLREIKSKVDENSTMLKRLVNDTLVSDAAPSSTSTHSKDMKSNLDLPLRSIEDVQRLERELKRPKTRGKYVGFVDIVRYAMHRDEPRASTWVSTPTPLARTPEDHVLVIASLGFFVSAATDSRLHPLTPP
ncbi:hypothetical protein E1301_Tti022787 [Triplophysa tibetana]|uniref:Uncharacterized protein n=1 Tax=Triplophysa tibetana TaxID=1572043 RepID=A0A5A9NM40_9TELE|nr:hypothetical protein E1301_Tti022787 [Triplophysa tibetana]